MTSLSSIGQEIRVAQTKAGVSNRELAKRLGVSPQTVSNYRKATDIKLSTLREICTALGLNLKVTIE
jgi:DNA-binding Xre family transcriptional regulator